MQISLEYLQFSHVDTVPSSVDPPPVPYPVKNCTNAHDIFSIKIVIPYIIVNQEFQKPIMQN